MADGFTDEQKQYLEGFLRGIAARHPAAQAVAATAAGAPPIEARTSRQANPLDMWDELCANAAAGRLPKGDDVFRYKFHGLFNVAPAQNALMCRLRIPNGILDAHQLRGIARIAETWGGGYADVTTRANLQIREIGAAHAVDVLMALQDLGLTSRGSGADNIRNITGSPTAGIDPQELVDTRSLARALHHYILNHRELYGLPRKFNIAFDGGGQVTVLEDTNDIGFAAVAVADGGPVPPGVYFRLLLGGITGHGDFARDAGVLLRPEECVPVAAAILRVFIAAGDRTDRKRARLKYLLDAWGAERLLAEAEKVLPFALRRIPPAACLPRRPAMKHGHVGIHRQRQAGLCYIGVVLPVGRLTVAQLLGLADIAESHGSGAVRLTVWQNLILPDVPEASVAAVEAAVAGLGLGTAASNVRGALVACTGNAGCRFSATDTKGHALALADHLDRRMPLDRPVNIHLTGCPHSCAQHAIGDIGLLGTKVAVKDEMVEGYGIFVGGGAGSEQRLGREIYPHVPMVEVPARVERMLLGYLAHRRDPEESFHQFAGRHAVEELRRLFDASPDKAA